MKGIDIKKQGIFAAMSFPTLIEILIKIQARGKKPEYFVLFSDTESHPKNDDISWKSSFVLYDIRDSDFSFFILV